MYTALFKSKKIWLVLSKYESNATRLSLDYPVLVWDKSQPSSSALSINVSGGMTKWGKADEDRKQAVTHEIICQMEKYLTQNKKTSLQEALVDL